MVGFEMLPREGDQFAICQMIEPLNPNDLAHQLRAMTGDMLGQLVLSLSGASDQHRASVGNGLRDLLKVNGVDGCVTTANSVGLMMDMASWIMWVKHKPLNVGNIEMQNARFKMIDPDDRMIMTRHGHASDCCGEIACGCS
jgi:hypothetical protein